MDLTPIEREAGTRLLDGDDVAFLALRQQAQGADVVSREFTGVDSSRSQHPCHIPRLPDGTRIGPIGGVGAEITGLRHGAGFVLFLVDGSLHTLEGFTYDEPWPDSYEVFLCLLVRMTLANASRRTSLVPSGQAADGPRGPGRSALSDPAQASVPP